MGPQKQGATRSGADWAGGRYRTCRGLVQSGSLPAAHHAEKHYIHNGRRQLNPALNRFRQILAVPSLLSSSG
eukprot:12592977-Alexandrium_andersonii.AAC.1